MVKEKDTARSAVLQGANDEVSCDDRAARRIDSQTLYDFSAKNMTPFGGAFLVGNIMERIGLYELLGQELTITRRTKTAPCKLIAAMVMMTMLGFERLQHVVHVANDTMLLGLLQLPKLPVQSTLWRFLNKSLHKHNERQFQEIQNKVRERIWSAANVHPRRLHINTDTTSAIAYGKQDGAKVGYCPGKRGAKCFRPLLSSLSETGEILLAQQRSGDRVGGIELAKHLKRCIDRLPKDVEKVWRADSEFYCKEAILVCLANKVHFNISVRKTAPVQHLIAQASWSESDISDGVGEFYYQPIGWNQPHRFVVARYLKAQDEQTDLFEDAKYKYRVFVTDLVDCAQDIVIEYDGRAGIENLIEEAKNQVAFAKIPGKNFIATSLFLQIVVIAFNMNRYLQLLGREEKATYCNEEMKTIRQTGLYIAARITDHGRQTIIHFGREYPKKGWFANIMNRLRALSRDPNNIKPVITIPMVGIQFQRT